MLIVGLGNPGSRYELTRHNLGFMLVERLAREARAEIKREECRALIGRAEIEAVKVELVKPQTFMNLSGEAVGCLLRKRAALDASKELLVISDDLALPLGKIRLRERGSSGGHNGLKSIESVLKTNEFMRLRIGIKAEHPVSDTASYVLERFPATANQLVEETLSHGANAVRTILRDGIARAMATYNGS